MRIHWTSETCFYRCAIISLTPVWWWILNLCIISIKISSSDFTQITESNIAMDGRSSTPPRRRAPRRLFCIWFFDKNCQINCKFMLSSSCYGILWRQEKRFFSSSTLLYLFFCSLIFYIKLHSWMNQGLIFVILDFKFQCIVSGWGQRWEEIHYFIDIKVFYVKTTL